MLAGRASVGALRLWNLFPWFGLSPDLWVRCRRHLFERAVAELPRPIKGEKGSFLLFFPPKVDAWKILFLTMI